MAMRALDRMLTIVVTATLTSAVWIVAGGTLMQSAEGLGGVATGGAETRVSTARTTETPVLDTRNHTAPTRAETGSLAIPVQGVAKADLVDTFTQKRDDGARLHEALDIMAPEGTPVVSAAPGRVERLFVSEAGGNTIYVRSADSQTIYYYAHLQSYEPGLREGQTVRAGQRIGTVGFTGNASPEGPHLHFAVMRTTPQAKWWEPSTPINPYPLLAGR